MYIQSVEIYKTGVQTFPGNQRHNAEFIFLIWSREKLFRIQNFGQSSTHIGQNCPDRLSGHRNFFPYIKKNIFLLSGTPV